MKSTKIKGYLNDLENKNKNFSYEKAMKILDISNYVYIDLIKKFSYKEVSNYDNSKNFIKEISQEFETIYDLIESGKVLMGACLLRNVYEEIMYIIASSAKTDLEINIKIRAGYFINIVSENCNDILSE